MLQYRQDSALNYTSHRFVAHGTRKYGHGASFAHFQLTTISKRDHHASVQIDGQMVLLDQL